jgi:hypothetical protein
MPIMIRLAALGAIMFTCIPPSIAAQQTAQPTKPECAPGSICFSAELINGQDFHKALNDDLEFTLTNGWTIGVIPTHKEGNCDEFAHLVNAPYRAHNQLYIDTSYGWTAEDEVLDSPREFRFVTNCTDYRVESERLALVLWPYTAKSELEYNKALADLGSSPLGTGRLWITGSRISHSADTPDDKRGTIEWIRFTVEIRLPTQTATKPSQPKQ